MNNIVHFVTEYSKRLSRPIKVTVSYRHVGVCNVGSLYACDIGRCYKSQDLEDVRSTMAALDEVRAKEIEMDMELGPIEECYSFLQRCGVAVAREEMEMVDSLRYTFKNLLTQAVNAGHASRSAVLQSFVVVAGSDPVSLNQDPAPVQGQLAGECGGVPP